MTKPMTIEETQSYYEYVEVPIVGTAPILIAHPMPWDIGGAFWEEQDQAVQNSKNIAAVLSDQDRALLARLGMPVNGKLTAEQNAHLRMYWLPDLRPGFPASGFMGAVRTATVQYKGKGRDVLTAKKVGGALDILGDETAPDMVAIDGGREVESPRVGKGGGIGGAPRLITRMKITLPWRAVLRVRYIKKLIQEQTIAQLIQWAGDWGIGQWRPSSPKGGSFGTWRLKREGD